jgi:hypothetical protein
MAGNSKCMQLVVNMSAMKGVHCYYKTSMKVLMNRSILLIIPFVEQMKKVIDWLKQWIADMGNEFELSVAVIYKKAPILIGCTLVFCVLSLRLYKVPSRK